jgi:hypothetical protein
MAQIITRAMAYPMWQLIEIREDLGTEAGVRAACFRLGALIEAMIQKANQEANAVSSADTTKRASSE